MEYLILGLLILTPMTGYELQQFIKQNLALICSHSAGSVQAALGKLVREGYVTAAETSEGRRRKKTYSITESGRAAFSRWVASRLRYPDTEDWSGGMKTVLVKFGVDQDGNTYIVEIIESPGKAFSDEAVRVIESSPAWSPGIYKGKKVRTTYTIPVVFR